MSAPFAIAINTALSALLIAESFALNSTFAMFGAGACFGLALATVLDSRTC